MSSMFTESIVCLKLTWCRIGVCVCVRVCMRACVRACVCVVANVEGNLFLHEMSGAKDRILEVTFYQVEVQHYNYKN